jgi:hypothetical protein
LNFQVKEEARFFDKRTVMSPCERLQPLDVLIPNLDLLAQHHAGKDGPRQTGPD